MPHTPSSVSRTHLALHKPASPYRYIFLFCFFVGLLFVFIVPPFQKPDETTHFYKAVSIASGRLVCQKQSSDVFQNTIPKYLADFPNEMFAHHISSSSQNVFPRSLYWKTLSKSTYDRSMVNEPTSCSLPFLLYLVPGFVLFLPVHIGLNPLIIFYIGRLANFLVAFLLFQLAFRIAPKNTKLLPLLILSLPIVLLQLSSFSKDALHLSAGTLALSYLLRFLQEKKRTYMKHLFFFLICVAVVVLARPQYMLFALFPFLMLFSLRKNMGRPIVGISLVCIMLIVGCIAFSLSREMYSANATSLGVEHPDSYIYPNLQWKYLQEYPFHFIRVVSQTLEKNSGFYLLSAISILGWLEFQLPWYISFLYVTFAAYVFLKSRKDMPVLSVYQCLLMSSIVLGTFGAIFLSFYLYASPVGAAVIEGQQGRYFILLIPYLFWLLATCMHYLQHKFIGICLIVITLATVCTLIFRYYTPTQHFYRGVDPLPITNQKDALGIEKAHSGKISVDDQKKIVGFSFFVFQQEHLVTKPYELRVFKENCTDLLQKTVIDVSNIHYNDWNDVNVSVISGEKIVCLTLQPYATHIPEQEALQIAVQKDKNILAIPLYVY